MDFAYTPQQEALRREVRRFINENVTDDVAEEIENQTHPRGGGPLINDLFRKIHEKGWLGIAYPLTWRHTVAASGSLGVKAYPAVLEPDSRQQGIHTRA